ncbi:Hypothetical predicted protein [Podarcis lilfordi]|uniref:Uncharacterized protein n=1 Tax=Podarcis lilfordi TaxID=74358 RepID=A0AA35K9Z3_9SAUR|nr:Hypothetical predicted protein [Podarcis lilfordi]
MVELNVTFAAAAIPRLSIQPPDLVILFSAKFTSPPFGRNAYGSAHKGIQAENIWGQVRLIYIAKDGKASFSVFADIFQG